MALRHLGKGRPTVRPHMPNFAYSVLVVFASVLVLGSAAHSAEIPPPPNANLKPSDSRKAPTAPALSDAQIDALMKEIGIRHDSPTEAAPKPEAKASLPQPTATPLDAQTQTLLREMGHWYDSRAAAAPRPEAKPSPPSRHTWRRYWRHYSGRVEADRGEATRLMREELQQRGVAVETASAPAIRNNRGLGN
jgi:hypothetical protein